MKNNFENILIFNVLEHVYNVENAMKEIKQIIKDDGKIFISTPFIYRYHGAPKDYSRYTLEYFEKISEQHGLEITFTKIL